MRCCCTGVASCARVVEVTLWTLGGSTIGTGRTTADEHEGGWMVCVKWCVSNGMSDGVWDGVSNGVSDDVLDGLSNGVSNGESNVVSNIKTSVNVAGNLLTTNILFCFSDYDFNMKKAHFTLHLK